MKYKIIFIDEEKNQHNSFADYMDRYEDKVDLVCMYPAKCIEDTIEQVDEYHPDAIISDYKLNDIKENIKYNVPFNGSELMDAYLQERPEFPCFVLTSFDDEAVNSSHDVNIVYLKNVLNKPEEGKITFAERIIQQIEHYKKRIEDAQVEIEQLIEKRRKGNADIKSEQRLIDLDGFVEQSLGMSSAVPAEMKNLSNMERLKTLISKTDELLSKLEKK